MIRIFFKNLFTDLYRQPLRTFLTLSGVVWGTFAIVLLLAFGDAVAKHGRKAFHGMGSGIVIVTPGTTTRAAAGIVKGKQIRLRPEDVALVKRKVPGIRRASPEFIRSRRVRYGKKEYNNTVRGVNVEYKFMRSCIAGRGRFLNRLDMERKRRVCFLGSTLAANLFKQEPPVGKRVFVEGVPFTVVGVMKEKIQTSNYRGQQDEHCLYIPYTTFGSLYGRKYINVMLLQPFPGGAVRVMGAVRRFLGPKMGFLPEDKDALQTWDFSEIERNMDMFFLAFNIFLGIIGAFTLMVGGVGVASIMLVVVEERVREIGVKLAVGAKRGRILRQFFSEAMVIILLGGIAGIGMAALLLYVLPVEMIQLYVGVPKLNLMVGGVTILVLLAIGTVSGIMPARKAASTDPIEALRK